MSSLDNLPDTWTYALVQAKSIIYAFNATDQSYFGDIGGGCYSIPMELRNLLKCLDIRKLVVWLSNRLQSLQHTEGKDGQGK